MTANTIYSQQKRLPNDFPENKLAMPDHVALYKENDRF